MSPRRTATATLEEAWAARTRAIDGGHLKWAGRYILSRSGRQYSPAAVAFRIRTGRDPVGYAQAECGVYRCVEPEHVEDAPGRAARRAQARADRGMAPPPAECRHRHDQAVHGRLTADGRSYCTACITGRKWVAA